FTIVLALAFGTATAQSCPCSYLTYVIRDAKGKVVKDPYGNFYTFEGKVDGKDFRTSIAGEFENDAPSLPPDLKAVASDVKGIAANQFCNFRGPATMKIVFNKKTTMELTFIFPRMNEQESTKFVVDSLPFKAGKYQIDLSKPTTAQKGNKYGGYYAGRLWKKKVGK
ncbi:MAG TPA: hypothetical protein VL501_05905, partial [Pyrinomonadaceae bacterium]|nr:hypothetical protein [Pyrinomonadaceae bacterium]